MMLFGFFQAVQTDNDNDNHDDVATGTYADGVIGVPSAHAAVRPRDRSQAFRRSAFERDYALARSAGQTGAGLVP